MFWIPVTLQLSPIIDTGWKYTLQKYAIKMNNIDKSHPNVPENDQNWIDIIVMAIIYN